MRPTLILLAAIAFAPIALAPAMAQSDLAIGNKNRTATRAEAEYAAYIAASVDTVVRAWMRAAAKRDADDLAELYTSDVTLALTSGRLVRGRGSVRDAYARLLPRLRSVRIDVVRIVASADVASVVAQAEAQVKLPSGGWYRSVMPMMLTLKADSWGRLKIAIQSGGDIQLLEAVAGSGDSARVVLTDASGIGVPGVLVHFQVDVGRTTLESATAITDTSGHAATHLSPGDQAELTVVRATAATLLEDPVFLKFESAGDADAAHRAGEAAPAPPPPDR